MANNDKENKIEKFTKEAIGKTLNQFNKEIGMADLVEINKNQDRILNGILSQVNDESTEKTEKSNIITLDNSTDGIVELKEIQGDTNVNISKIEEMPITHDIGDKEGNVFTLNEIPKGAISIGEIQGNTMVNCNKDDKKELVLMKDLSTQGDNSITLTEGVDGGKVDVALEGNTLVNVSKTKDSTAISMSYTVENSGNHVALQGDVDGSCRPVITGNTLVNLVGDIKAKDIDFITLEGNCVVFSNPGHVGNISWDVSLLKPSTTYTLIISVYSLFDDGNSAIVDLFPDTYQEIGNWTTHGMRKIVITTPDDISDLLYLRYYVHGAREGICKMSKPIILEGDYSDKPISDYFDGLQSSFEDNLVTQEMVDNGEEVVGNLGKYKVEYKVTGKNKFNPMVLKDCPIASIDGDNVILNGTLTYHWWYKVTLPKGTYSPSGNDANITLHVFYDGGDNGFVTSKTFTYDSEVTLQGYISSGTYDNYILSNLQIEEGDTVTSYEPYKEHTKTLYLNSPLLEGDTIEQYGNNIAHVHRYSKVVLDGGTSPWGNVWWTSNSGTTDTVFSGGLSSAPYEDIGYCDKLLIVTPSNLSSYDTAITIDGESIIRVNIPKTLLSNNKDLQAFRTWLNANPITLVGKLKTPTYELIEQSNLATSSYSNGHLDFESAVPVEKVEFKPFSEELIYLYPSTSYTVQFVSDRAITVDFILGGTELLSQSIVKGLNRISITTPATLVDNRLIIDGVGANISEVVVTDTNRKFKYFEGMKSVGECEGNVIEIVSQNKNLIDINRFSPSMNKGTLSIDGDTITYDYKGTYPTLRQIFTQEEINLLKGKTFKFGHGGITDTVENNKLNIRFVAVVDGVDNYYSFPSTESYTHMVTLPDNMEELEFSVVPNNTSDSTIRGTFTISEMQLLFADVENTNYTPHQTKTQQLTHEPLRAVGNVKDRYVLIDGKWYIERNCIEYSSEYLMSRCFLEDNNPQYNTVRIGFDNLHSTKKPQGNKCDKYKTKSFWNADEEGVWVDHNFKLSLSRTKATDLDGAKEYLRNNPFNIVCENPKPVYEEIDYNPLEVYSDITHITTNSTIPTNIAIKNHGFNCLLKPSTTYTISSNRGLSTVTTGADIGDSCLRFYNEDISTKTTMKNVLILEGDWTSKANLIPSNFSGIESCFEQELVTDENDDNYGKYKVTAKVVGKNLIPYWEIGKYDKYSGKPEWGNNYIRTPLIHIHERQCIFSRANDKAITILTYDKNKEFLKCIIDKTFKSKQITLDNNVHYIVIHYYTDDTSNILQNIEMELNQLEQGDTATEYEPYKESNVTFYLDEPLRGVEGVKDRVYVKDDKVVVQRNCGTFTLNSKNGYSLSIGGWENKTDVCTFEGYKPTPTAILDYAIRHYTDTLPSLTFGKQWEESGTKGMEGISGHPQGGFVLSIKRSKLKTQDINGLDEYLRENPIRVVYQLAEPVYEEVEYSSNRLILNTFNNESFNNSTLFLDTNISPKLSFKPLYEELVYVKNSTKYYIQFNAVGSGEVVINLGGTELTTEIVEGYNYIPITTPSESTNLMVISGQGITISEVIVSEVVCGGYYKGLQSCFEEHMENGKYRVLLRGIALDGSKVNGIKLYINEPLRGVEDTKDRLCIKNGKLMVERKCGEEIFDGSDDENWRFHKLEGSGKYAYVSGKSLGKYETHKNIISNVKNVNWNNKPWTIADNYFISFEGAGGNIYSYSDYSNLNDFKSNLNNNPIIVVYPKDTIIYEEATNEYGLPIVFEGYENGVVYIDSAVTPTTHIKYTSNNQLATTLSEAEEQNIATQEDINMNVITYMMDIDMMLTDMEMSNDISVMAVRRDSSNENMLDRMSKEDKKVYQDNTVVMLEKMITANVLEKEDIEGRINMYYNKNRISKEQYEYLKSLL